MPPTIFQNSLDCGQTELPDRSVLIGQKLVENARIGKIKKIQMRHFLTMCRMAQKGQERPRKAQKGT